MKVVNKGTGMVAGYFIIPLYSHAGLVEYQDYLRDKLPGAEFVNPETFHITLLYMPDGRGDNELNVPTALPIFGLGGEWMDWFETPDGYAVHVRINATPQLTYLQAALFYEVRLRGINIGTNSWPGLYKPHVTLAYTKEQPPIIEPPLPLHFHVDRFELSKDEYQTVQTYPLLQYANQPVSEMAMISEAVETQFVDKYPSVPYAPGIDVQGLLSGDSDPMFVTLKVAEVDSISGNGRYYDREFINGLYEQILAKRPPGNRGHIPDSERATLYPEPAGYWVGATLDKNTLWGKAYIPANSSIREEVRIRKLTKGKMSTSIYGMGTQVWDDKKQAWRVEDFVLESIDFAPAERAGVSSLATVPLVTSEMKGEKPMEPKPIHEVIQEMKLDHIKFIPQSVIQEIVKASNEAKMVAELRTVLGESADVVAEVKALRAAKAEAEKAAVEAALVTEINAAVLPNATATDKDDDPVKSVRALVGELVRAQNPANPQAVKEGVAKVVALPHISTLIKAVVVTEMGPRQRQPITANGGNDGNNWFEIPEEK